MLPCDIFHIPGCTLIRFGKQPLVDSNNRMQQSKCCALPLGERAIRTTFVVRPVDEEASTLACFILVPAYTSKSVMGMTGLEPVQIREPKSRRQPLTYIPFLKQSSKYDLNIQHPLYRRGVLPIELLEQMWYNGHVQRQYVFVPKQFGKEDLFVWIDQRFSKCSHYPGFTLFIIPIVQSFHCLDGMQAS